MKALILAGGEGTRLRPITHTRAKQLVPVANKPILFYGIEAMVAAGIEEIGVITGATGPEVRAALGDGSAFGAKITYLPQEAPLGLAHCVLIAGDFLGADDFVMYLGDNLLEQDLSAFIGAFEAARRSADPPSAQILLKQVPDPHRFGIATLDEHGHVVELVEKPDDPPSDLALVGVYLFDESIHDAVRAISPSARGELEITDAIQWLITNGRRVRTELLTGWWIDTGKLTPLLEANRLLLEKIDTRIDGTVDAESSLDGRVVVAEGAEIVNSTIRGPVAIGRGHAHRRQLRRSVQCHRQRVRGGAERGRALGRDGRIEDPPDPTAGGQLDRSRSRHRTNVASPPRAAADDRRPLSDRRRVMVDVIEQTTRQAAIDGLVVITMKQVTDDRGTVREFFRRSAFEAAGLPELQPFVQVNVTESRRGAIRGLHAEAMTKLVAVARRRGVRRLRRLAHGLADHGVVDTLTLVPGVQVLVPAGVANGFQAVVDGTQYVYCFDREWQPDMAGIGVQSAGPGAADRLAGSGRPRRSLPGVGQGHGRATIRRTRRTDSSWKICS